MTTPDPNEYRLFSELSESGLLWLINRVVFHPRGFRLAIVVKNGQTVGWQLQGDGTEPHWFAEHADQDRFHRAEATLNNATHAAECDHCGGPASDPPGCVTEMGA